MMRLSLLVAASLMIAGCGRGDGDRLDDNQVAAAAGDDEVAADRRCTAAAIHEAVKRELFRRAAEIRGSNAENYARIAGFALLVMDGAAPTEPGTPNDEAKCGARATLKLPPNLAVAGGRTSITGRIGFNVSPGASPDVTVTDGEAITLPLATLMQRRDPVEPAPPPEPEPEPDPIAPLPEPAEPAPTSQPSFDCDRARTKSEYAVCASPSLAALDRVMASRYRSALANAGPGEARLLAETRDRFLGYRNACGSDACIAQTYRGRMREIDDIMAGRWQPPR